MVMNNKIDINKLEVKEYKKGSYLNIQFTYKNDTYNVKSKFKMIANEIIKINNEFINQLLLKAEDLRKEVDYFNHNLKLSRIRINGYTVWVV